ncbi:hypothetical protein CYMTET_4166 [Cymbomonas tetramitiformis]|uniref:Uncharacterized protein n=1 Tax=Cymbomonas tetramitiformis TaxID=36881 RepID=A0AAE0H1U2_9CHLO|nr:hypothetical protein CYMTET_4166 [Cymbomonas tetramitiformis]
MKREFTRKATGGIKFETVADLVEHTKGLELKPTYPPDADVNAVVVLPNGVFEFGDNFGFCFSTRNILQNAERARDAWGGSFPGETDGTELEIPILRVAYSRIRYPQHLLRHRQMRYSPQVSTY